MPTKLPYADFVKKTSMFRDRVQKPGAGWQAVLSAYEIYSRDSAPAHAGDRLYLAIEDYMVKHGNGSWSNVDRNKESKGYLKALHDELGLSLAQERKTRDDILNSRFGVLYVLSAVDIDMEFNAGDFAAELISNVGGAVGAGVGTQYGNVGNEKASEIKVNLLGQDTTATEISSTSATAVRATPTVVRGVDKVATMIKSGGSGASGSPWFPSTLSALTATASAMSETLTVMQNAVPTTGRYGNRAAATVGAGVVAVAACTVILAGGIVLTVGAAIVDLMRKLWEKLKPLIRDALMKIVAKQKVDPAWNYDKLIKVVGMLTKLVLNFTMKSAVPFLSAGIDCATGCVKAVDAVIDKIKLKMDRGQLTLMPGHPHLMADYIEKTTMERLGKGLLEAANGAASIVTQVFAPGLGSLIGALTKAVAWAGGWIMKFMEHTRLTAFLREARTLYAKERERALAVAKIKQKEEDVQDWRRRMEQIAEPSRGRSSAISIKPTAPTTPPPLNRTSRPVAGPAAPKPAVTYVPPDPDSPFLNSAAQFTRFFHRGCKASPLIPMVVLRSHLCGSLISFLKLTDPDGELRFDARRQFDAGERYFGRLKKLSLVYIEKSGFNLKHHVATSEQGKATVQMILGKIPVKTIETVPAAVPA